MPLFLLVHVESMLGVLASNAFCYGLHLLMLSIRSMLGMLIRAPLLAEAITGVFPCTGEVLI
jgi:hypothetical protein